MHSIGWPPFHFEMRSGLDRCALFHLLMIFAFLPLTKLSRSVLLVSVLPVCLYITLGFQIASRIFYKNFCELERPRSLEFIKKLPFGNRIIVTAR